MNIKILNYCPIEKPNKNIIYVQADMDIFGSGILRYSISIYFKVIKDCREGLFYFFEEA